MSAVPVEYAAAASALRLVPAMPVNLPPPTPIDPAQRIVNTIRCQTEFCGVPLCGLTKRRRVVRLHGHIDSVDRDGDRTVVVATCPSCAQSRTVTVR